MYKRILSPAQDNLPEPVIEFLNYLSAVRGKSLNTVDAYRIDLALFFKFIKYYKGLSGKDIRIEDICIHDVDYDFISSVKLSEVYAFINYITVQRGNGANARARKTAAIKSFYNYMVQKAKILKENPVSELETPKVGKRNPIYMTLDESKRLLKSVDGIYKERDYAIIMLFLNCGLRLSELVNIDLNDIKEDTLTVLGKGSKERTVYLNKACIDALSIYLPIRLKDGGAGENRALFLSERKKRISKRTVQYTVQKYIEKADLSGEGYSVHKLRHTAATLMYKHGNVDIRTLQMILGHESVSTTEIYMHVDDEELRKASKKNPLSGEV